MDRQVILLEDLSGVFEKKLSHVFGTMDQLGLKKPLVYSDKTKFLSWVLLFLISMLVYAPTEKRGFEGLAKSASRLTA